MKIVKPNLNVGCGNNKNGAIRIDINPNMAGVNLVADAHYLPLRNKSVSVTLCRSVLEHVENPTKAMFEMKRVTLGNIIIIVPNVFNALRMFRSLKNPMHHVSTETKHLQGWDAKLMKHLAYRLNMKIISFKWQFEKIHKWGFICPQLFCSHMTTTFQDFGEYFKINEIELITGDLK